MIGVFEGRSSVVKVLAIASGAAVIAPSLIALAAAVFAVLSGVL
jgi:hypothetical protein